MNDPSYGPAAKRLQGTALPLLGSELRTLDCQGRRSTVRGSAWRSPPGDTRASALRLADGTSG